MNKLAPDYDYNSIRVAIAEFNPASRIEPNEQISPDRVFTPDSHRSILDLSRQLVVGNRGMGKSLWTHALLNSEVRQHVAEVYRQPNLTKTIVVIGFNGSDKLLDVAPTRESIGRALENNFSEDDIWRAVIFRAVRIITESPEEKHLNSTLLKLKKFPNLFEEALSSADDILAEEGKTILILFDALDRLADNWKNIRSLTSSLMKRALGLKSFKSFRTKIFIRPDQYADASIFQFPDGSKLKSEHVNLSWQPQELFGLLLFEVCRNKLAKQELSALADDIDAGAALRFSGHRNRPAQEEQKSLINALAGTYMGADARRGRVYTWVPLHLSDAKNACSPRTFLTAWKNAAEHEPAPLGRVVDHLGLIEGVRQASSVRLEELREDYRWIDEALAALKGQFVPISKDELLEIWEQSQVVQQILTEARSGKWLTPVDLASNTDNSAALLEAMKSIAVMEERSNGKINVPDIFRVEAGIMRKGGVAVPRRG
jgi:hypothetical protein